MGGRHSQQTCSDWQQDVAWESIETVRGLPPGIPWNEWHRTTYFKRGLQRFRTGVAILSSHISTERRRVSTVQKDILRERKKERGHLCTIYYSPVSPH